MGKGYETWTAADGETVAGRVRTAKAGKRVYDIRCSLHGKRHEVTTGKTTLHEARVEFALFLANPAKYKRERKHGPQAPLPQMGSKEPIYLDEHLSADFLAYCRDEKRNSSRWLTDQRNYLAWWAERLAGLDLRRVSFPDHIDPVMKTATAQRQRGAVLLGLYKFLRKKRNLDLNEDPVHGRLTFPEPTPEQWKREKAVEKTDLLAVLEKLEGHWRDALLVQAGTGWHGTEARRFAMGGKIQALPPGMEQEGVAGVLVSPLSKGKELLKSRVSATVLEAGKRLLERGSLDLARYADALKKACADAKVPEFSFGVMRHTVATFAINSGAPAAEVSASLNHKNVKTTRRFYATHASPKKTITPV